MKKLVISCLLSGVSFFSIGQIINTVPEKINFKMIVGKYLGEMDSTQLRIELKKRKKFKFEWVPTESGSEIVKGKWKINGDTLVLITKEKTILEKITVLKFILTKNCLYPVTDGRGPFCRVKGFPKINWGEGY